MQPDTMPPTTNNSEDISTGSYCRPTMESLGIRKPSWMQLETMPPSTNVRRSESEHAAEWPYHKTKEAERESLLAQRHIVVLLVMEAVYAVSHVASGGGDTFSPDSSECRRMLLIVQKGCTHQFRKHLFEESIACPKQVSVCVPKEKKYGPCIAR